MSAMRTDPPKLECPRCGEPLIEAHGRGRYDRDGNEIRHRDECRCRWCTWWWIEDEPPVECACGALVTVRVEDEYAYAVLRVKP